MSTPLYNDELEDFVRQQADDHRMYPSDKLWRNIQVSIHGETRWPALTYISIFIIASLVATTLLMKPETRIENNVAVYANSQPAGITAANSRAAQSAAAQNSPLQQAYTDKITQRTIETVNDLVYQQQANNSPTTLAHNEARASDPVVTARLTGAASFPQLTPGGQTAETKNGAAEKLAAPDNNAAAAVVTTKPASMYFSTLGLMNLYGLKTHGVTHPAALMVNNLDNEELWRNYALLSAKTIIRKKLSKFNFQFYVTPSLSYRQLTDAKGKAAPSYTAIPLSANYKIDINNIVKHTASSGAEVGFALGYRLNNRFTVKTGLQFNVRQYNIEAYPAAWPAVAPATVDPEVRSNALSARLATSAQYTQASSSPVVLRNRYYEAAAPIGLDYKVYAGNSGAVAINVAATVQPTYTFDKEPFVITTDYKNYADGSTLMRNWNINSSVEAYVSYQIGPLRWQIGPQLRYQHLPTYGGGYPIREHLLDYGVKLGFTRSLR